MQVQVLLKKPGIAAIEWRLLAFLVLFMDVKLGVKAFAIFFIYFLQPDFHFGFKSRHSRLPWFYLLVIAIAVLNFIRYQNFSASYSMVAFTGILFWTGCILAIHQVKLFAGKTPVAVLHNTLTAFFVLNIAFSVINLLFILWEIGLRNPFLYQGLYQKYFVNTGDFIKGISFDTSTTNAVINCFGIVYFLYRKKYSLTIGCMIILLITASNFSNIVLLFIFAGLFLFKSTRQQKSIMAICTVLLIIFFAKVSPQNKNYVTDTLNTSLLRKKEIIVIPQKIIPIRERPDSLLTADTRKEKIAILFLDSLARENIKQHAMIAGAILSARNYSPNIIVPKDSINSASFQWKRDTTVFQHQLLSYMQNQPGHLLNRYDMHTAGKVLGLQESIHFMIAHPATIITGNGAGNFSSKLAFRATGLGIAGTFPQPFTYCSPAFLNNHLGLYIYFFSKHADSHSIINSPASVYDQLLTEYGLAGLIAFPVYYIGFFLKHFRKLTYGLPLMAILLAFFMVDYWFEQLSVVVLFELILFINIKENTHFIIND